MESLAVFKVFLQNRVRRSGTASQIADIPVPGRGVFGSPQGSLPEQSTAKRTASQIADIPVPGLGGSGCLLGSLPGQRTTALDVAQERISERIEQIDAGGDFPSRRAGPRVVRPRQGSAGAGAEQLADIVSHGPDHVDEHLPESAEWVQSRDPNGKDLLLEPAHSCCAVEAAAGHPSCVGW